MPKKKVRIILDMGFTFLMCSFWHKGFSTTLSTMPVHTCHNLLSVNLKAYNYMVGNDTIISKCLHDNMECYDFKATSPNFIACMNHVLEKLFNSF